LSGTTTYYYNNMPDITTHYCYYYYYNNNIPLLKWQSNSNNNNNNDIKILKPHSCCTARATFFAERIVNTWNSLPHDSIDFSSLHAFKRGIEEHW